MKWEETGETEAEIEFLSNGYETLTAIFVPLQPSITEIHYNPEEGQEYEFLEIHNPGTNELDLGGYRFEEGIEFTFPANTFLGAGEFLILAKIRAFMLHWTVRYCSGIPTIFRMRGKY